MKQATSTALLCCVQVTMGSPISLWPTSGNIYPPAMVRGDTTASSWSGTRGHVPITEQHSRERQTGQERHRDLSVSSLSPLWGHSSGDCPGKTRMGTPASQSYGGFGSCQPLCQWEAQDWRERSQLKSQAASVLLRANWTDDGIAGSCICF